MLNKSFLTLTVVLVSLLVASLVYGQSWEIARQADFETHFEDVTFIDAQNGWAVGYQGTIVHTTDGGAHWESQTSGTSTWLQGITFFSSTEGWAVGQGGIILHTTDSGNNWEAQTSGTSNDLWGVTFFSSTEGWTVGRNGAILHTTNGGDNWEAQTSGTSNWLNDIYFFSSTEGWTVGDWGTILHTTDGGDNWEAQISGTSNGLWSISYGCGTTMWAVGDWGIILKYTDLALPVELSSFTGQTTTDGVMLKWRTESEVNNLGFNVYRSDEAQHRNFVKINSALIKGHGTDAKPYNYTFLDETAEVGKTYFYLIEDVDFTGKKNRYSVIKVMVSLKEMRVELIPNKTALFQCYPNPSNPETWIPYQLAEAGQVKIKIYSSTGQLVRYFSLGYKEGGYYLTKDKALHWDGTNHLGERVSSGVYFYSIETPQFRAVKKMLLLK